MKFFKNSLILEDFIQSLADDQVRQNYSDDELKRIAEDFELSKRIKKPDTIIRKIKEIEDPKEFIRNKLKEENVGLEKDIETMPGAKLIGLIRQEGLNEEGSIDRLRDRLRKHFEQTLTWEEYRTDQLAKELEKKNIIMDPNILNNLHIGGRYRDMYRKSAIKLLDLYEAGELITNFKDDETFEKYVFNMLKRDHLSTKGSKSQKELRFYKSILERYDSRTDGSLEEMRDRIMSVLFSKNPLPENLSREGLESNLNKFSGNIKGSDEELKNRLTRFLKKRQTIEDYSTEWIKQQLKKEQLSEEGSREDLITRYEIVSLKKEVVRLRKELDECHRRKNRTVTRYSRSKKKSGSSGFGSFVSGAIVGSILSRRNETKIPLKF